MQRILIVEDDFALSNGIVLAMKKEAFEFIQCFDKKSAKYLISQFYYSAFHYLFLVFDMRSRWFYSPLWPQLSA